MHRLGWSRAQGLEVCAVGWCGACDAMHMHMRRYATHMHMRRDAHGRAKKHVPVAVKVAVWVKRGEVCVYVAAPRVL